MGMKVTIREYKASKEPVMRLFMTEYGTGIRIRGEDANGEEWAIADIDENGISLCRFIHKSTNWPLDEHGSLKLVGY